MEISWEILSTGGRGALSGNSLGVSQSCRVFPLALGSEGGGIFLKLASTRCELCLEFGEARGCVQILVIREGQSDRVVRQVRVSCHHGEQQK